LNKKISYVLITVILLAITVYSYKLFILFFFNNVKLTVPNINGLTVDDATLKTKPLGLSLTISSEEYSEFDKGKIISQTPEPDIEIKQKRNIEVIVSKGIQKYRVPDFRGLDLYAAKKLAEEHGLKIKDISRTHHEFEVEQVISSDPKAGNYVIGSNEVSLLLSLKQAVKTAPVPDLIGVLISEAEPILKKSGFVIGNINYVSTFELDNDLVIETVPAARKEAPLGTAVNLIVNKKE
jgi:eukaryotic-like serine/threonine-protein kinase